MNLAVFMRSSTTSLLLCGCSARQLCRRNNVALSFGPRPMSSSPSSPTPVSAINEKKKSLFNSAVIYYEQCLGLAEVHRARSEVNQCEDNLYRAQQARREKQTEIKSIQNRLKDIHSELDRTQRGEDRYLYLLTEEHEAIKRERELLSTFEELEAKERDAFNILSNKVRISHEREREREERTKYWSLTGSLVGAVLGIVGTSIASELRMRHIRDMIPAGQHIRPLLDEMVQIVRTSQAQVSNFLEELKNALKLDSPKLAALAASTGGDQMVQKQERTNGDLEKAIVDIKEQSTLLGEKMEEMKQLIRLDRALASAEDGSGAIVYVGDSMEAMLQQTEMNIESKMKLQTLVAVVGFYATLAITVPLIYYFLTSK